MDPTLKLCYSPLGGPSARKETCSARKADRMGRATVPKPTGVPLLIPARSLAPLADPTIAGPAPRDWAAPHLWTPGDLMCVAIGNVTFDDPGRGRITLEVSFWRDPTDPTDRYSAMVETG